MFSLEPCSLVQSAFIIIDSLTQEIPGAGKTMLVCIASAVAHVGLLCSRWVTPPL